MKSSLAWTALLFSIPLGAHADDDPTFDAPKTSLFDYRLIEGGLYVSFDPLNSLNMIEAQLSTTQAGPHFSWHGYIDLHVPWNSLNNFEWSDWDVAVGGQWHLSKKHKETQGTQDELFGIGIQAVSYLKNAPGFLEQVDVSDEQIAQERISASLQGALATLGWVFLSQKEDQSSVDSSIQVGAGIGRYGFTEIGNEIGWMGDARLEAKVFDGGGNVIVILSGATNGEANAFQITAGINMSLGNHVNIGMLWKSEGFEGKKLRASLNQLEFKIGAGL